MKVRSQFHMLNAAGGTPTKADPLVMCKPLRQPSFALGQLVIRPLQMKRSQYVRNDTLVCCHLLLTYKLGMCRTELSLRTALLAVFIGSLFG